MPHRATYTLIIFFLLFSEWNPLHYSQDALGLWWLVVACCFYFRGGALERGWGGVRQSEPGQR